MIEQLKEQQLLFALVILLSQVAETTIRSVRTIMLVKGRKFANAILAFVGAGLWAFVIGGVLSDLSKNVIWLVAYCIGATLGHSGSIVIENKVALGTLKACFVINKTDAFEVEKFLETGKYEYFIYECYGNRNDKVKIDVIVKRKDAKNIRKQIESLCKNKVSVTNYDTVYCRGVQGIAS